MTEQHTLEPGAAAQPGESGRVARSGRARRAGRADRARRAGRAARPIRPARWRNIVIYIVGVLALAGIGGAVAVAETGELGSPDAGESAGMLLFILSPILVASLLRWFGKDGWADAGLRFKARGNGHWYLLALLLFPALSAVAVGLGAATGAVTFAEGAAGAFAAAFAVTLVIRMVFAAFEEFGWRGYLEPRLANLGVPAARRHLIVAAVWGVWHVPYILAVDVMTDLPLVAYLPLFLVAIVPMSFIYGVVRERTGSVWPAVLMHGMSNAVAFPLLLPEVLTLDNELVFAARPEGLITLAGLVVTAAVLWRSRTRAAGSRPV